MEFAQWTSVPSGSLQEIHRLHEAVKSGLRMIGRTAGAREMSIDAGNRYRAVVLQYGKDVGDILHIESFPAHAAVEIEVHPGVFPVSPACFRDGGPCPRTSDGQDRICTDQRIQFLRIVGGPEHQNVPAKPVIRELRGIFGHGDGKGIEAFVLQRLRKGDHSKAVTVSLDDSPDLAGRYFIQ